MTIDTPLDAVPAGAPVNRLLPSPILPTSLRLARPHVVGEAGPAPLAAIALVFPFAMLTQMMSAGAMGGGVSSAISRALGAGDRDRAAVLALDAPMIGR